jgi:hypothetical protein
MVEVCQFPSLEHATSLDSFQDPNGILGIETRIIINQGDIVPSKNSVHYVYSMLGLRTPKTWLDQIDIRVW